jgi:hypothetical protein
MSEFCINQLASGGLIANYYCSSNCRHCLYKSSPYWPKSYCSRKKAVQIFRILYKAGCESVHIGGGEPFLNPDGLIDILKCAKEHAFSIEYIETNSSWFNGSDENIRLLEVIRKLDVSRLRISISPFHNEYIPFNKVKGLLNACTACSISISSWLWDLFGDVDIFDDCVPHSLEEYESMYGDGYICKIFEKYHLKQGGRALELFSSFQRGTTVQSILAKNRGGCSELEDTSHFQIDLFGNYIPGFCAGLSIRMEDIGKVLSKQEYPVLTTLRNGGISGLLDYVRDIYGFEPEKPVYISKCDLCYEIRSFLINTEKILSHELRPYEHYQNRTHNQP